jgi:hypothetical protein
MSLKHLFAGIMGVVFALALGVDPLTIAPGAVSPVAVAADTDPVKASPEKPPERSARDRDKERVAERSRDKERADKRAGRDSTWARRLVFPSGNKF